MGVPIGEKFKLASNISYLMKRRSDRSIFNVGRVEMFMPVISSEPGYHPFRKLLFYSSNVSDEQ